MTLVVVRLGQAKFSHRLPAVIALALKDAAQEKRFVRRDAQPVRCGSL